MSDRIPVLCTILQKGLPKSVTLGKMVQATGRSR